MDNYIAFLDQLMDMVGGAFNFGIIVLLIIFVGALVMAMKFYRKVPQGRAIVRNGVGGTKVSFSGILVVPIIHHVETIDISVKRIEIDRSGANGLICKDNIRADIKVAFFVRVNQEKADVERVAQSIGCDRASSPTEIEHLFDAKFSEALKTVGKRFDFVELYEERDTFRDEILKVIGTDLNGFILDDASIDYLEQTPVENLDPDNILDAEGIKKITDRTAAQAKLTNNINRDKEKVIRRQDVEAREAILELDRQLAEAQAKQEREIAEVRAREGAEAAKVESEQLQKSEQARIAMEEEVAIATENKDRQVIVAQRNKERTDAVEQERVERDRSLEQIERERVTQLKAIERDKELEVEKKAIQDVIKERVAVEKTVVIEQEKIKDTEAFAAADRSKQVKVTNAEAAAQEALVREVKEAEARRDAATRTAEEQVILAEAERESSEKLSAAKKVLAEGITAESAAAGLGEANVVRAKAEAEAAGIVEKAEAMKKFHDAGKEHEEFKLELEKAKQVELAEINAQVEVAERQAKVVGEALKHATIDIVGGESKFFDQITRSIGAGKSVDRLIGNSVALSDIKETFFNGDPEYFRSQMRSWVDQFGISSEDLKNLSISAVLGKMVQRADDPETRSRLESLLGAAERFGMSERNAGQVMKKLTG